MGNATCRFCNICSPHNTSSGSVSLLIIIDVTDVDRNSETEVDDDDVVFGGCDGGGCGAGPSLVEYG